MNIKNIEKYQNMYITLKDYNTNEVITYSKNAKEAYDNAILLGVTDPVILFIDVEEMRLFILEQANK